MCYFDNFMMVTKYGEFERSIDMMLDEIEDTTRPALYRLLSVIDVLYHTQRFSCEDIKMFRRLIEERIRLRRKK